MREIVACFLFVAPLFGQDRAGQDLVARIRAGGWFCTPTWRRGTNGSLEVWSKRSAIEQEDRFIPLLGDDLRDGITNPGTWGIPTLWLQGGGDLLAMTGGEFHLQALGLDDSDVALRQHLLRPVDSTGPLGRAEMLDRMVIIDVLQRRRCRAAIAELTGLLAQDALPEPLRQRAQAALAGLQGRSAAVERHRLSVEALPVPQQFDFAVVVEHARLPDMRGAMAAGRRSLALKVASRVAERAHDESWMGLMQQLCDRGPELPFGLVLRLGNVRLDHSCTMVALRLEEVPPLALCYQAAGEFEAHVWAAAAPVHELLPRARFHMTNERITASTGLLEGELAPEIAARLLEPTEAAIRVVVPESSKLRDLAAKVDLTLRRAEVRISFDEDSVSMKLTVDAGSEAAAKAWCDRCEELRRRAVAALASPTMSEHFKEPDLAAACRAALTAGVVAEESRVIGNVSVPILRASGWEALAMVLAFL